MSHVSLELIITMIVNCVNDPNGLNMYPSFCICFSKVAMFRHFCFCSGASSEGPNAQKFFSFLNNFSEYGILMLMESPWLQKAPHMSHDDVLQEYLLQVSHFVHLLMISALLILDHSLIVSAYTPWKWLAQRETELRSTVNSPQTSHKTLWTSVEVFPCIVLILMCDLQSSTVTVPETCAGSISSCCYLNKDYAVQETKHMLLPQAFNWNWRNFHCCCVIQSAVLPTCALLMKCPSYYVNSDLVCYICHKHVGTCCWPHLVFT